MIKKIFFILLFLSTNLFAASPGDVVINEIMWMGTAASTSDEWIELYNNTEYDVDISSWVLKSADDVPKITLKGVIPSRGYFLLERTDDNTVKDIVAEELYSGALTDAGEDLMLYDSYSVVMDSVPCNIGWFAGAKTPNYSMERKNTKEAGWLQVNWGNNNGITINGLDSNGNQILATPGQQNSIFHDDDSSEEPPASPEEDYKIRITEVSFASSVDWVELYNYGPEPVDISKFTLTDLDGTDSPLADTKVTLDPGKYAVVYWDENGIDETDEKGDVSGNGRLDLYLPDSSLSATDDEVVLMSAVNGGEFLDAVCWSNLSGDFSPGEQNDVELLIANNMWQKTGVAVNEADCWTNSSDVTSEKSLGLLTSQVHDANSKNDWYLFNKTSPGLDNPDITPPQAIADLNAITGVGEGEIVISWTATGDDGIIGKAARYEVCYSTDAALTKPDVYIQDWQPGEPGQKETYILKNLALGTTYYLAIKANDELNNFSTLSNIAVAMAQQDKTPPLVEINFTPQPPFLRGKVQITLIISDVSEIVEKPWFSFCFDENPEQEIFLDGSGKNWQGEFEVSTEVNSDQIAFRYLVMDGVGNISEGKVVHPLLKMQTENSSTDTQNIFYCGPNPFSPSKGQQLRFANLGNEDIEAKIFSLNGELIKTLWGQGELVWTGTNENGQRVSTGIYLYYIKNNYVNRKGRIVLLR